MAFNNIEIELRFPLYNLKEAKSKLNSIAQIEKVNEHQKDTYYVPAHKNFFEEKPVSNRLRLRESSKGSSLDYKHYYNTVTDTSSMCDEFMVQVDNVESFKEIFKRLDFKELIVVDKVRNIWKYKDVEIAIDEIENLGVFVELEAKGDFEDEKTATSYLHTIADELDLSIGEQDFKGYPYMMLEKNTKSII